MNDWRYGPACAEITVANVATRTPRMESVNAGTMSEGLYIRFHLGGGDLLICHAIVRHFAVDRTVYIPVKFHNLPSANFQFRDNPRIRTIGVKDDADADNVRRHRDAVGLETLGLGMFGERFEWARWDQSMYAQAGVPIEDRWSNFYVEREPEHEVAPPPDGEYAFVHHDPTRAFVIDPRLLPNMPVVMPTVKEHIFQWWRVIECATEIHVVDSAFLALVDLLPSLSAKRLVLHRYATNTKYGNSPAREPSMLRRFFEMIT